MRRTNTEKVGALVSKVRVLRRRWGDARARKGPVGGDGKVVSRGVDTTELRQAGEVGARGCGAAGGGGTGGGWA